MQVPTNKIGLLFAEIGSAGSLRLAGDRVLFGAHNSARAENEWLTRQKVARCQEVIAEVVHRHGGIVSTVVGDQVFCHLPDPDAAFAAACEIQRSQPRTSQSAEDSQAMMSLPLGVRIAIHFGNIIVDAGKQSGPAVAVTRDLVKRAETDQIIVTQALVVALHRATPEHVTALGSVTVEGIDEPVEISEILWQEDSEADLAPTIYDKDHGSADARGLGTVPSPTVFAQEPAGAESPKKEPTPASTLQGPAAGEASGLGLTPKPALAPGPRLHLRFQGKELWLDREHPALMLRSGKERVEHARIVLSGRHFFLDNLNLGGTRIRYRDGTETLCLDRTELTEQGAVSLGTDFSQATQIVTYAVVE